MIKKILFFILLSQNVFSQNLISIQRNDYTPYLFLQHGNSIGKGKSDLTNILQNNIGKVVYEKLLTERYKKNWTWYNKAEGGTTIANNYSTISTRLIPYYDDQSWTKIIVAEVEGTNTIALAVNGYTAFWQMVQYKDSVLNSDPRVCLVIYQMISCTPTYASDTARQSYNTLLAGLTETSRFKVVSIASEPLLNASNAYLNTTYYGADGIHLTTAGYLLLANLGYNRIKEFLQ